MQTYAIDFETSYSKERDIKTLGTRNYLLHPETDIYLISIYGDDLQYVGHPKDAPWNSIAGHHWVSHNAFFDFEVWCQLREKGVTDAAPHHWNCTSDMAVYLGAPRSLAKAAKALLDRDIDKTIRDEMKGKVFEKLPEDFQKQVKEYALNDAITCFDLWAHGRLKWPAHERLLSSHTRLMKTRGIGIDMEKVEEGIKTLKYELFKIAELIPWHEEVDEKGDEIPLTSPKELIKFCVAANIPPPETTASKSPKFDEWFEKYGDQAPCVKAVGDYRKYNRLLTVLERVQKYSNKGRLYYGLKYFGAHTGRWSGDDGLNMQNFPRKGLAGIDVRSFLVPKEGYKFIVADYSQIEPRVLCWLTGQQRTLDLIAQGIDLYEAYARATMGYDDPRPLKEVDPTLRQLAKACVLGLGYGCGGTKFKLVAKMLADLDITESQAKQNVHDYRFSNPEIIGFWRRLEMEFRASKLEDFEYILPSGRKLTYRDINPLPYWSALTTIGGNRTSFYGGKLCENIIQATARDLLADAILNLEDAGIPVVLHVHDEVVCEVPENTEVKEVEKIMLKLPEWAKGLPVSVDVKEMKRYGK